MCTLKIITIVAIVWVLLIHNALVCAYKQSCELKYQLINHTNKHIYNLITITSVTVVNWQEAIGITYRGVTCLFS